MIKIARIIFENKTLLLIASGIFLILAIKSIIFYNHLIEREVYFYSDDAIYARISTKFLSGNFYEAFHPYWNPGFPAITIPFYFISGKWELSQILVSITSTFLLAISSFWFYQRFSYLLAFLVVFFTTFSSGYQRLILQEGISEPFYILNLWTGIFLSYLALTKQKFKYYVLSGIFFAIAYLTRTECLAIIIVVLSAFALKIFVDKKPFKNIRKKFTFLLPKIGLFLVVFVLINLPYIIIQSHQMGRFAISGKTAWIGGPPFYSIEKTPNATWAQDVFSVDYPNFKSKWYDPKRANAFLYKDIYIGSFSYNFNKMIVLIYKRIWEDGFFQKAQIILAIIGLVIGASVFKKLRLLLFYFLAIFIAQIIWIAAFMSPQLRYLSFAFPIFFFFHALLIYSGVKFLSLIINKNKISRFNNYLYYLVVALVLTVIFSNHFLSNQNLNELVKPQVERRNINHKIVGEYLKNQGIKVYSGRSEAIAFYADAKLVYFPAAEPDKITDYMRKWGTEFLVVQPDEVGYDFVKPISNPNSKIKDLELLHRFDSGTLLWRLNLTEEEKKDNFRTKLFGDSQ